MTTLQIRELPAQAQGPNAELSFDQGGAYPLMLTNPVSTEEEAELEWYFEEHLRHPFLHEARAEAVVQRIQAYGHRLFRQIFADPNALADYKLALRGEGVDRLRIEIIGSPEFNAWHWECLHDPDQPRPFALDAVFVRKNRRPPSQPANPRPSPTLNVLLVTARPRGARDVAYRTISRPLVEMKPGVPVRFDFVRPGTYKALVQQLEQTRERHGVGFYHLIHFDAHGGVLDYPSLTANSESGHLHFQARYGRADLAPFEGLKGFIFLESETDGLADPVEAKELANLLQNNQIPLIVLNACQSGKQIGAEDSSLGARLLEAGARQVLAMAYSVTVSAAQNLMQAFYRHLFEGQDAAKALSRGRAELWSQKARRAYYDQTIDLEDWLLPVLYEDHPLVFPRREFTVEESKAWYERQGSSYTPPILEYGFVGRDLDVLAIERRILAHNLLLVRGMGGAGKTSLLHHLAQWWQTTGLVEQVFYFGYDRQAWNCQQIYAAIGLKLLGKARYYAELEPLSLDGQKARLAAELNQQRHLLILDNLESITGASLAIPTLPPAEQQHLRAFLAALAGGKSLVLLGSRDAESWLAPGTFNKALHELKGLDAESATALAERVLERHGALHYRQDPQQAGELADLLKLLAGFPHNGEVLVVNLNLLF